MEFEKYRVFYLALHLWMRSHFISFTADNKYMPPSLPQCKAFKTFEEQADRLISRNLIAEKEELISRLQAVNYYRLTGYLYSFRETIIDSNNNRSKAETYRSGTTLDLVWKYYLFDRRLRLLLLDAIERIEITLRTHIAYYWSEATGSPNPQKFQSSYKPDFNKRRNDPLSGKIASRREDMLKTFQRSFDRSIDECVLHHKEDLGFQNVDDLPIWVFIELSTIGELAWIFSGLKDKLKMKIATNFGCPDIEFFTSLITLVHHTRNACAHHSRIWNKFWIQKDNTKKSSSVRAYLNPIVKDTVLTNWNLQWKDHKWNDNIRGNVQFSFPKTSTAFVLTVCKWFLKTSANTSTWHERLEDLLTRKDTPSSVIKEMGFPDHWENHPLWL